jgi:hypothetical protein
MLRIRPIAQFEPADQKRLNNPPAGLISAEAEPTQALDTDYDGRSFFPRQVFIPISGEKYGLSPMAKNLKAEIDEEVIKTYRGTESVSSSAGRNKRVAVKIVDDRGIESPRIISLQRTTNQ